MLNKVDGIKKLSKKELEESRKIVLASINEEFKKGQELLEGNNKTPNKKVDGIFSSLKQLKNNNKQQVQKKEWKKEIGKIVEIEKPRFKISGFGVMKNLKNIQNQEDLHKKDKKNDLQISNNNKQAVRGLVANKEKEDEILKIKEEKIREMQLQKQRQIEQERLREINALKEKEEEKKKKKEEEEKRKREKEQLILKKQEEERRTKERERLKEEKEKQRKIQRKKKIKEQLRKEKEAFRQIQLEAREKSREKEHLARMQKKKKAAKKREALIKKYKSKIKSLFKYLHLRTFKTTKKVIYFCLFFLVVILILYFIFVSVILKFDIDNVLSRFVADFIPVPALATSDGIIEYYKYKDLKDNFKNTEGETDIDKKIQSLIVREIAINNLIKRYGVSFSDFENHDKLMEFLESKAMYDNAINQVAINRIKKIKGMIDDNNDFVRISTKFGDKMGKISINKNTDPDKNGLKDLEVNEISEVIFSGDGYYIFRCYYKTEEETTLNYVFVKSKTLDDYLSEYIKNYKLLSFVD